MLSSSPTVLARSSLELMLESLRHQDEKPKDLPPALPSRPTSRARLPSARRSLPVSFRVNEEQTVEDVKEVKRKSDNGRETKINTSGGKKVKSDQLNKNSPYGNWNKQEAAASESSGHVSAVASTSRPAPDWDDNIGYFFKKKLRVWCRQPSGKWDSGTIQSISGDKASIRVSAGNVVKVSTGDILPANPDRLEGVHDLIQLSYLNEPSVLHNLQHRYLDNMIYSKAGPVLIAVNPFKDLQIYGSNFISSYREKLAKGPHVYAVADAAYDEMMNVGANQSIIISGQSGAGKTETAKFAMQYLASLGGGGDGIEKAILQTSCILEAFGNAKTSRNNNSSRFGKLIEIHFSTVGTTCGAVIQTLLLEKSRVVQLAKGERSFHVFYQLCAGSSSVLRDKLNIKTASEYNYLNQSDCLTIRGVDDAEEYHKLMEALHTVQIDKNSQESMLSILAAILWLGNIKFEVVDSENRVQVVMDEAVTSAAKLMGCSVHDLTQALSTDNFKPGKYCTAKNPTLQQAEDARDALAKYVYARLFDWLVDQINKSLAFDKWCSGRAISILDIYGFESFQRNGFEQFCINYANERLQQHFYHHLFKLHEEEYEAEGVDWIKVDFEDNQECLNLFEKKPFGLLSLLDEESYFHSATDSTFADKLKQSLSSSPCFTGGKDGKFSIRHYAGEVLYDTPGFLEKNRDPLPSESIGILLSCSSPLLRSFASSYLNQQSQESIDATQCGRLNIPNQSLGTKFKGQLYRLMHLLENTTPHFICCLKPNHKQLPGIYEMDLVAQQLKSCGVPEVVRTSRSNYSSRITHQNFAQRFGLLLLDTSMRQDPLEISVALLQQYNILPEMYQVGYTKLYFRTAEFGGLENMRNRVLQSVVGVQKCFRGYKARCHYHEVKGRIATLQSFIRGQISRREYASLSKKHKAGVANAQNHKHKRSVSKADNQQKAVVELQSAIRGTLARRQLNDLQSLECINRLGLDADENIASKITEAKVPYSVVAELRRQLVKAEAKAEGTLEQKEEEHSDSTQKENHGLLQAMDELKRRLERSEATVVQKEEENAAMKVQLQQYENRWSEYEVKMRSMEEMWQNQIKSLQTSLMNANNSLAPENTSDQRGRHESSLSPSPCYFDSDDNFSPLDRTPGASTPVKLSSNPDLEVSGGGREANGSLNPVNHLAKEFEQIRQGFDEDAKNLLDVNRAGANPEDDLKRLKMRFVVWKKEYKSRLRETKGMLQKHHGNADAERKSRKWWGKKSQKRVNL